jgi:hypothetical protein
MILIKLVNGMDYVEGKIGMVFNLLEEDNWLMRSKKKAVEDLKYNFFEGKKIKEKQITKKISNKSGIDNLWWRGMSNAWRLVYSVITPSGEEFFEVRVEYFIHKNYGRRFRY